MNTNSTYKKVMNYRQQIELKKEKSDTYNVAMRYRQIFNYDNGIYKLETIRVKNNCFQVLRINKHSKGVKIPDFLQVIKDIRDEHIFSTLNITHKD